MIKSKLALILDSLFISFLVTFVLFIWLNHKTKNANLLHFFLILINLLLFVALLLILFKRNKKRLFSSNNEKYLSECLNYLIQCNDKAYSDFLSKLINCKKITPMFYKFKNNYLYINIKTCLTPKDYFVAQELFFNHKLNNEKLIFIYYKKDKSFDEIIAISKLEFHLISYDTLLELMIQNNIFPIEKNNPQKTSLKQKLRTSIKSKTSAITKSHFKEIFLTSISLLFLSLVVPFSNYYLITGTILLIISIISLFKKDFPSNKNDIDFFN